MSSIIVTFIHYDREIDLSLPNHIESQSIAMALHEWLGHGHSRTGGIHDLEYSFDLKHWFRLEKHQTFESAGIWDGAFLRLSKEAVSSLRTEKDVEKHGYAFLDHAGENGDDHNHTGHAWKIID
ncbi:hypothetical protein JOD45_000152 [Scopulibacillus daqui]|uniref:Uncharacterized protein n=1 Tax=Scopulibacillus daqui TaxID=1469162 RepID=A0ABS2PVK0_9BACL|nr:hypothetical protein [Scopulibacillus daqui]MBM7643961.1 hypothetical protein [Scopulibacillus daqui]